MMISDNEMNTYKGISFKKMQKYENRDVFYGNLRNTRKDVVIKKGKKIKVHYPMLEYTDENIVKVNLSCGCSKEYIDYGDIPNENDLCNCFPVTIFFV